MSTLNVISKPKKYHHHKNIVTPNQMITQIKFIRYENIKTKLNRLFENTFYQTNIWNIGCCANNKKVCEKRQSLITLNLHHEKIFTCTVLTLLSITKR
jgi:hypothetical protein